MIIVFRLHSSDDLEHTRGLGLSCQIMEFLIIYSWKQKLKKLVILVISCEFLCIAIQRYTFTVSFLLYIFYCTFNQGRIIRPWFNTFIDDWNSDFQLLVLLQYIEIHEILPILFSFVFENKTPISEKPSPCDLDMIQIALYRLIVYDYNQRQFVLKQLRCFYYVLHRECT